ncbi:MAG: hypothetical protein JW716_02445 [Candidatus Aenigmarchaeota archaeon]|nr:hypothetical protein [Candidatus Aenigmarchaeota archaeon]
MKKPDVYFVRFGFWFGNLIVKVLERLIPRLRDKDENLHGFRNDYLKDFNLSDKELFKRYMKHNIRFCSTIFFWCYFSLLLLLPFEVFTLKGQATILAALFILMILFFVLGIVVAYRLSRKRM